jgi:hypothetical protein
MQESNSDGIVFLDRIWTTLRREWRFRKKKPFGQRVGQRPCDRCRNFRKNERLRSCCQIFEGAGGGSKLAPSAHPKKSQPFGPSLAWLNAERSQQWVLPLPSTFTKYVRYRDRRCKAGVSSSRATAVVHAKRVHCLQQRMSDLDKCELPTSYDRDIDALGGRCPKRGSDSRGGTGDSRSIGFFSTRGRRRGVDVVRRRIFADSRRCPA